MLVLTRKPGQVVFIGPDITVEIVRFKFGPEGARVVVGITAPEDVPILRDDAGRVHKPQEQGADP